jgi:hypothetical protein
MRRCDTLVVLALIGLVIAGGAGASDYDPYKIPKDQLQTRVHKIALVPIALPADTPDADGVRQRLERMITQKLTSKGYTSIPSTEYGKIWLRMAHQLGGIYDPITGEPDKDKLKTAHDYTARELSERLGADTLLDSYVVIGELLPYVKPGLPMPHFFAGDEILVWQGKPIEAGDPHFFDAPEGNLPQKVFGTRLNVGIYDLAGTHLYGISVDMQWTKVFVARNHEDRPVTQLYQDPSILEHAVNVVLDPLVPAQPK